MVTQEQINKLKKELAMKRTRIGKLEEFRKLSGERKILEREIKRARDPRAFLRREKTKRILRAIGKAELRGLKLVGKAALKGLKATGRHLAAVAQEQARQDRMPRKMPKRKKKRKKK